MAKDSETVRIIRVFVSSPGDVTAERAVLDEFVSMFNRSTGPFLGVRLELWQWDKDVIPSIGTVLGALLSAPTDTETQVKFYE